MMESATKAELNSIVEMIKDRIADHMWVNQPPYQDSIDTSYIEGLEESVELIRSRIKESDELL